MQTNFTIYKNFIAKYRITPQTIYNIQNVPRLNPSNIDCVVNAMEIIGILSRQDAGLVRTRIGVGIIPEYFLEKFQQVNPEYIYRFVQISMRELIPWILYEMLNLTMIFCGYLDQVIGHVYIIAKDNNGKVFLLDPQLNPPICNLDTMDCFANIANKLSYHILVRDNIPMNIDEFDNSVPMDIDDEQKEQDVVMNRVNIRRNIPKRYRR